MNSRRLLRRHAPLLLGVLLSMILLLVLVRATNESLPFLRLKPQWLIVAGVPLLLGLVLGGYLSKFKGLGIELEAALSNDLANVDLDRIPTPAAGSAVTKASLPELEQLPPQEREKAERLAFQKGHKKGYYDPNHIHIYLERLPRVRFLEVQDLQNRFLALLPIEVLCPDGICEFQRISDWVRHLEGEDVPGIVTNLLRDRISERASLLEALRVFRMRLVEFLAVVDSRGQLIGVLYRRDLESQVLDELIRADDQT